MNTNKHYILILCVLTLGINCVLCGPAFAPVMSIPAFNGGEWAPKLEGRQDVKKYYASCRTVENMLVLSQGPATKRTGTYYIGQAAGAGRLIEFDRGQDTARVIEMGDKTMRFFK